MASFEYKYLHSFRDRHGKLRNYFRRGHRRIPIPGTPGTQEFHTAYLAAIGEAETRTKMPRDTPGTIRRLTLEYYASPDFQSLAHSTKQTYRGVIDRICDEHGHKMVKDLKPKHVMELRNARQATPQAANTYIRMLRTLMRFAIERGYRDDDPTIPVKRIKSKSDGFRTWTMQDIEKFEEHWHVGTRANLAMRLLFYTGQRRSDVVRLGHASIKDGFIHLVQQKTGAKLEIPIAPKLKEALDQTDTSFKTFLVTQDGKAFSPAGFSNWFVECAQKAGLPKGSTPHGLRKALATRLAELGRSPHQIKAITGHTTLKEVDRYTTRVNQKVLAAHALDGI